MLTSVFRAQVKDLVKKSFYRKRKKKTINVLTVFFISHKSDVKIFLKWILNQCPKGTHLHDPIYIYIYIHGWYLLLNSLAVYLAIYDGYVMKDCMDVNDS